MMAKNEKNFTVQQFVKEIDFNEIEREEIVGKGSFGVVWKGKWRGKSVAVKRINSEAERKAFAVEVRQLSRVAHPNIVKLYGACTDDPVCLVMEYAEGGSLYNVLHSNLQPFYTAGHAISWALQCAKGVAYLHNLKPKPIIHRDLKPPNLLLIFGGQTLKICDFGTACDLNTYMTNNKGSAAWMAPEVFEGSRYTEKCDIFSWGIILWEMLSRRKPFDNIGGLAYRIMWAVHNGQRPPLLENCPRPIEDLLMKCWSKMPDQRPSMNEIVDIMSLLLEFFSGHTQPIDYSPDNDVNKAEDSGEDSMELDDTINSDLSFSVNYNDPYGEPQANVEVSRDAGRFGFIDRPPTEPIPMLARPCNLPDMVLNTRPQVPGLPQDQNFSPLHIECDPNAWKLEQSSEPETITELNDADPKETFALYSTPNETCEGIYNLIDTDLRPVYPDQKCAISPKIYEEHKILADEYLRVQTELALLCQHKEKFVANLNNQNIIQHETIRKLMDEKESLVKLYKNLKRQLEIMEVQQSDLLDFSNTTPVVTNEDGWVLIPRRDSSRLT